MKIDFKNLFITFILFFQTILNALIPNTVVATINVGVTPDGMAITKDNKFAYVANNNNYSIPNGDSVSVLNLTNNTLVKTIHDASFNQPYTITIDPSGKKVYATNSNSTTITIIDTQTNKVVDVINGFDGPSGLAINNKGSIGYVNNYGGPEGVGSGNGKTISVVNLQTKKIIATINVDLAPAALTLSSDGKFLYVINYVDGNPGTGTLNIIDTSNNKVIGRITGFSGPFAIALNPNGKLAYVTNFGSNNFAPIGTTVSVVDLQRRSIIKNIQLAIQPSGIAVTPDGSYAYATNYNTLYAGSNFTNLTAGQGTVNIIDLLTNKVIPPTIAVGQSPHAVVISSDGRFAYVPNFTSNTVSVIFIKQIQNSFDQVIINKFGC